MNIKRCFAVFVFAILGMVAGTWAARAFTSLAADDSSPDNAPRPHLILPVTEVDLGTVSAGTPLTARFRVTNDGQRRLIIRFSRTACCGLASEDALVVPPGRSADLVATASNGQQTGHVRETIKCTTNDPATPSFDLVLSADVR